MRKIIVLFALVTFCISSTKAQWSTVCSTGDGMIVSLAKYQGSVFACGFFTTVCGTSANYIARWDGSSWHTVDTGLRDAGHNIEIIDTDLYVAPYRQTIDSNWLLRWNGSHFDRVGSGVYLSTATGSDPFNPNIYDVAMYRGHLVVCGEFDRAGGRHISGIMQWNGSAWDSVGTGLAGSIGASGPMYPHQLLVVDTSLYVVGNFATAGGITVNGVARWDGSSWHAMGAGFNSEAYGIGTYNGVLYVGGDFTASGSMMLQGVAKWDGSTWIHPGFGVWDTHSFLRPYVHTAKQISTRGVFEGGFNRVIVGVDTFVANNVFALQGTTIDTLAGGIVNANFEGLIQYDSSIMVGGAIWPDAGGNDTTNVSIYGFANLGIQIVAPEEFLVSPLPFHNYFSIGNVRAGDKLSICNLLGQTMQIMTVGNNNQTVDASRLPAGAYTMRVEGHGAVRYKEVFKQ